MGLYLLLQQLFCLATTVEALASQPLVITKPDCPDKCGNVSIPYPFGIRNSCYSDVRGFNLSCNGTSDPPKLIWGENEVLDISLASGLIRISNYISYKCYTVTGKLLAEFEYRVDLDDSVPFAFSETHNKFTAIGCDTVASISSSWGHDFTIGCLSLCSASNNYNVINTAVDSYLGSRLTTES